LGSLTGISGGYCIHVHIKTRVRTLKAKLSQGINKNTNTNTKNKNTSQLQLLNSWCSHSRCLLQLTTQHIRNLAAACLGQMF